MPRLLHLLVLLALVLMPIAMSPGGHFAAAAQANAAAAMHCADMGKPLPAKPQPGADCAAACSALPAVAPVLAPPDLAPSPIPAALLVIGDGVGPDAVTPPPRLT